MTGRGGPQFIPRPETWRPGGDAPWASRPLGAIDAPRVRDAVPPGRGGRPSPVAREGANPSAVLVALYPGPGGASDMHVVLTRRSWDMRTHRGEVSLPGGRCEGGESPVQAALRESLEEIDLDPASVEVLGELDHLTTVTRRAYIVPVVGLLPGRPTVRANPAEVEAVLQVSLAELLDPAVFREERWGTEDLNRPVFFFELVGDTVWGATAAILRQLLALLVGVDPGTPEELDPARGTPSGFRLTPEQEEGVV